MQHQVFAPVCAKYGAGLMQRGLVDLPFLSLVRSCMKHSDNYTSGKRTVLFCVYRTSRAATPTSWIPPCLSAGAAVLHLYLKFWTLRSLQQSNNPPNVCFTNLWDTQIRLFIHSATTQVHHQVQRFQFASFMLSRATHLFIYFFLFSTDSKVAAGCSFLQCCFFANCCCQNFGMKRRGSSAEVVFLAASEEFS